MGGFGHVYLYQHLVSSCIHLYAVGRKTSAPDPDVLLAVFYTVSMLKQESGDKIAVKLCRLELNSKNKDRWSREIQIMKK